MLATKEPQHRRLVRKIARFLNKVGLPAKEGERFEQTFVRSSVWIHRGEIVYDVDDAHPGDMLHEAGHLAVLPRIVRVQAMTDLAGIQKAIDAYFKAHPDAFMQHPEDPVARALLQSGDCEAIAWSYAAAKAADVDPFLPFASGFRNDAEGREVFAMVDAKQHFGINGLRASGFLDKVSDFPKLKKWLVD